MSNKPELLDPERLGRTGADDLYGAVRLFASFTGPGLVVFEEVVARPLQRRQEEFTKELAKTVNYLLENGLTNDDLRDNESFQSACVRAFGIWMGTSQESKRRALQNALRYTGRSRVHEDAATMAWTCLDRLTPSHIAVLDYLARMPKPGRADAAMEELAVAFPDLAEMEMLEAVLEELYQLGLIDSSMSLAITTTTQANVERQTVVTKFGSHFLDFIRDEIAAEPDADTSGQVANS